MLESLRPCLLIAVLGEAAFSSYWRYKIAGFLPDLEAWLLAWLLITSELDAFYLLGKIITLGILCASVLDQSTLKVQINSSS